MMHLLTIPVTDTFLPDLGEKLTLIAALAFFLYYFMKELKQVRERMDQKQTEYDKKFETMFERVAEMERKSMDALNKVSDSNDRLADAVEGLKDQLNKHS